MKNITYVPIIKMADAELRGIENLSDESKDSITPLFELTRSRKTKKNKEGDINRRLSKIHDIFGDREFILDLTSDPNLTNNQIEQLQSNKQGYRNWMEFITSLKSRFTRAIPVIQISDEDVATEKEMYDLVNIEIQELDKEYDKIAYRFKIDHEDVEKDLNVICGLLTKTSKLICIIDSEFIPQNKAVIYKLRILQIIKLLKKYNIGAMILAATSFPKNPIQYGGEDYGTMRLEERYLFDAVAGEGDDQAVIYGDYATLNPIIVERAGGNGWVPRIDMPMLKNVYYYRSRKRKTELTYIDAYVRAAKGVVGDNEYISLKKGMKRNWGVSQIEAAANGSPQGLSPSFWISVRMNIHISNYSIAFKR